MSYEVHYPHGHIEHVSTKREADRLAMEHYKRSNAGPSSSAYGNFERVRIVKSNESRNRVMGPSRRRNAPSTMFHAVVDRGNGVPGMFQPEIIGSDPSLSTVRVRAKIAADSSGLPVAVMDDHHKVIKVYQPTTDTVRVPRTRNMAGHSAKRIEDRKSKGHIAFKGDYEFFDRNGEVYMAPRHLGINDVVNGTRHGRWESSRAHFERYRKDVYGV